MNTSLFIHHGDGWSVKTLHVDDITGGTIVVTLARDVSIYLPGYGIESSTFARRLATALNRAADALDADKEYRGDHHDWTAIGGHK